MLGYATSGNSDGYQRKGVVGGAVCKVMKIKDGQTPVLFSGR